MNIFNKRPLLLSLFVFAISNIFSAVVTVSYRKAFILSYSCALILLLIIFVVLTVLKKRLPKAFLTLGICMIFALIAAISSHIFFDIKLCKVESLGEEKNVVAVIKESTYSASYLTTYTADIKSIDGIKTNFTASISATPPIHLEEGDAICADMSFSPFTTNKHGYDARNINISNGILTSAEFSNAIIIEETENFNIISLFNVVRRKIENIIVKSFRDSAHLIKALLIGKTDGIDTVTKSNFSRLGISHILSISGTHFSVLLGMVAVLLSTVGINKRYVYVFLIPLALFYMGLSGFSFSVCRAGIMALLSYWGFLCGRNKDSYTSLFISLAIILIISPYAILSISLWLSFTATLTILIILDLLAEFLAKRNIPWYKKIINYISVHVLITVSIIFATLPIVSIYFGYISKISPVVNLVIVPLFELLLYIIPFSVCFSKIYAITSVADTFGGWLINIVESFAEKDNLLLSVNQKFVVILASIGIIATLVLVAVPLKNKIIVVLPSIICIISIAIGLFIFYNDRSDKIYVSYFNSNVSDAIVITDSNQTACIDITAGTSAAMYLTQSVVKNHYSASISSYVFTHYRSGHIKAFDKLASRTEIKTAYFPVPSDEKSIGYMEDIIAVARKHNIDIVKFEYNTSIKFQECEIVILEPQFISRSSHEILSVYISSDKEDILYLGSSFSDTKFDYSKYISEAEYIILGQHYPKTKNRFMLETNAKLIYGSKEIYNMSDIPTDAIIMNNGDGYHFLLN